MGIGRRSVLAGAVAGVAALSGGVARAAGVGKARGRVYGSGGHTVVATPLANGDGSQPLVQIRDVNRVGQVLGMLDAGEGVTPRWPSAIWADGRVTVLPSPVADAADCGADRLNDGGQAAGYYTVGGRSHATVWTGGVPRVLDIGTVYSRAYALDNAGQVAVHGYDQPSGDTATWNTVCLVDGSAVTAVAAGSGTGYGVAGLNDRGEVLVSTYVPQGGPRGAYLWRDGAVVADFSDVDGSASFLGFQGVGGLNACGDVVGDYDSPYEAPNPRIFHWSDGTLSTVTGPGDSAAWVSDPSLRRALNDAGDFVGVSSTSAGNRPFLWSNGVLTEIGTLGGRVARPVGVNNARQVAGISQRADGSYGAFLWRAGELIDLAPPPGFDAISVDAITEQGDVLGSASTGSSAVYFRFTVL
jgi:probable HAF family extracellular repeat protein